MSLDYLYNLATDRDNGFIAGLLKVLLFILSLIYGLIVKVLIWRYSINPKRLDCKVISVGNITLGGTGKTALVEFIAKFLKEKGLKSAILSRGYKTPDEPLMLKRNLGDIPVIVDADRVRAAERAISDYQVKAVILDDGFQQWRIKKDLEIVAIDVTCPFGNQHLLPRGILREPLSALKRADIFILTKTNLNPDFQEIKDRLNSLNAKALVIESIHQPVGFYALTDKKELSRMQDLKGATVALFCGIGDPDSFESMIMGMGINVGLSFKFGDHYSYLQQDLDKIAQDSQKKNIHTIITTEKDAARISLLGLDSKMLPILVLGIELAVPKDEERLFHRLAGLFPA
ncbi:MAG: tetraacyldisaccharide 4'-kinase [Omnitrophica WOR_2 bacterium RBG_13_41_10]|nr:MAG: tetraacyldisaccharide 4'-kinase [Omnitrophica WOR_2 bacterium RBG_13_41_10]